MLPDLIEIIPLAAPVKAEITVPGSKSITNRALILAALADGEVILKGALWSEDTQIMVECLKELGFVVNVAADPDDTCNRTITMMGEGGMVPHGGTEAQPLELFVGNAGTAARFLAPFLCLGSAVYRLHGVPRMHERPQAALFKALRELGYRIEAENSNDKLPARIYGTGPRRGKCQVSIEESSQFASALLLSTGMGGWQVEIAGENEDESPYVAMTSKLMRAFPNKGGVFQIEPDASSGSYFWAAGWQKYRDRAAHEFSGTIRIEEADALGLWVIVNGWPKSHWQIDQKFPDCLAETALTWSHVSQPAHKPVAIVSRKSDLGDSIMTAIVSAPFFVGASHFTDLGRLRVQECERVVALRTELTKCGAKVVEEGDTLTVWPATLHGAEIETYNDHRMAMCFAVLGLKVPGIRIKNPACVKKTFPNFFQKVAEPPPRGVGAEIWEVKDGQRTRKLSGEDLFAD